MRISYPHSLQLLPDHPHTLPNLISSSLFLQPTQSIELSTEVWTTDLKKTNSSSPIALTSPHLVLSRLTSPSHPFWNAGCVELAQVATAAGVHECSGPEMSRRCSSAVLLSRLWLVLPFGPSLTRFPERLGEGITLLYHLEPSNQLFSLL